MTKVTVYDPAMCCSTGICGAEVDQNLVDFAANLDWLKTSGVEVTRINLSQEPTLFAENADVKGVLESSGVDGLPVIFVSDAMQSSGRYPSREELAKMAGVDFTVPETEKSSGGGCCGSDDAQETSSGCC